MPTRFLLRIVSLAAALSLFAACSDNGDDDAQDASTTDTLPAPPLTTVTAAELCASAERAQAGTVANPELVEISGLASSRTQDVLWAHNDSGDRPRVFAIGPGGGALATYDVIGAEAIDWEDMAIGPGPAPDTDYLYMGDIGDNASLRPSITVYSMEEPVLAKTSDPSEAPAAIVLQYPDGAHDAETLLVDPTNGDLYIITKNIAGGPSGLYGTTAPLTTTEPIILEKRGEIDFAPLTPTKEIPLGSGPLPLGLPKIPTGGEISPDGTIIAVRTYGTIWLWQRAEGQSVADALAAQPCEAPSEIEPQGEAIAFSADGRGYVTASEGANVPINSFALD